MNKNSLLVIALLFILVLATIVILICILLSTLFSLHKLFRCKSPFCKTFKETFFKLLEFFSNPLKNL